MGRRAVCATRVVINRGKGLSMFQEVSGDILLSNARVIAHGVAPNDGFSTGLAHALREQWPGLYKDFRHYCQTRHPKGGELWSWMAPDGKIVVSLFTQDGVYGHGEKPGRASTHNVGHALRQLQHVAQTEHFASVALPRLATGVGGLAWNDVYPLIKQHLGGLSIPVIVYTTYRPGDRAAEQLA